MVIESLLATLFYNLIPKDERGESLLKFATLHNLLYPFFYQGNILPLFFEIFDVDRLSINRFGEPHIHHFLGTHTVKNSLKKS